jgi:hypothetical protein
VQIDGRVGRRMVAAVDPADRGFTLTVSMLVYVSRTVMVIVVVRRGRHKSQHPFVPLGSILKWIRLC